MYHRESGRIVGSVVCYNKLMTSSHTPRDIKINLPLEEIGGFCVRWKITELSVFGSVLRDDFGPDSDLDFLVSFDPQSQWSLLDHAQMELDLIDMLGRDVDLVSRRAIETSRNPIRKSKILQSAQIIYAA